ncbi:hypothetical protein SAMN05444156_2118 [Verrucomicrobium sp. GAS474]|nr:hypothetical protein SAMN05444156_2118 [Verrucomicrobium sp. GAS474]
MVLACYVATQIADGGLASFFPLLGIGIGVVWVFFGGSVWWLPLFAGMGIGGVFYFGFKVHPFEVGFFLSLAAALPLIAMRAGQPLAHRSLPRGLLLFLFFICLEAGFSCARFSGGSTRDMGSILRIYLKEFWAPFFLLVFYYYGKSRFIAVGFYVLEFTYLIRLLIGMVAVFIPNFTYLPGVNMILPASGVNGTDDLRASGLGLAMVAMMMSFYQKGWLFSMLQRLAFIVALIGVGFGGGRGTLVGLLMAVVLFALFSRRKSMLWGAAVLIFAIICLLNLKPELMDGLNPKIQRTASILIVNFEGVRGTEFGQTKEGLEGDLSTNDWHHRLAQIGRERWTANLPNFLFGTGIRSYDETALKEPDPKVQFALALNSSADTAAYEDGLWTVLATSGLVTLVFYVVLFGGFIRKIIELSPIMGRTPFGRSLVFLSTFVIVDWVAFCYWQGGFPSYELMVVGATVVYLQDYEAEFKAKEEA